MWAISPIKLTSQPVSFFRLSKSLAIKIIDVSIDLLA